MSSSVDRSSRRRQRKWALLGAGVAVVIGVANFYTIAILRVPCSGLDTSPESTACKGAPEWYLGDYPFLQWQFLLVSLMSAATALTYVLAALGRPTPVPGRALLAITVALVAVIWVASASTATSVP